jgi:hypothetical protein
MPSGRFQENKGLKLNGTHPLLVYADYVNLLGKNINIIKKTKETLLHDSKVVGLEINAEKIQCMFVCLH